MISKVPRHISLHAVDHCNLNCEDCGTFSPHRAKREYEPEQYFEAIDKLLSIPDYHLERINISGGEPFLHSDIVGFTTRLHQRYPSIILRLQTNGFWVKSESIMQKLEQIRFAMILVTVYGGMNGEHKKLEAYENVTVRKPKQFYRATFTNQASPDSWCPFIAYPQILTDCTIMRCPIGYSLDSDLTVAQQAREGMFYDLKSQPLDGTFLQWIGHPIGACNYCRKSKI